MNGMSQLLPETWRTATETESPDAASTSSPFAGLQVKLKLPDFWQQAAVKALQAGKDVVVHAPTGAGKTFIFELFAENNLKGQAIYTVPTRALANDKLAEWRSRGWDVGIATGDIAENLEAKVIVATLETQKARFLRGDGPSMLVVDEYQLLSDPTRGVNYELSLALAPRDTQLLLLSGSVANPDNIVEWFRRIGRQAVLVQTTTRPVPLQEVPVESLPFRVPKTIKNFYAKQVAKALMADLGPILVFAPQRNSCEKLARQIAGAFPHEKPLQLSQEQERLCGSQLASMLKNRVAYHHSGLSYSVRAGVIEPLARAGQLRVVVATMGLAAGINFSMRSVMVTDTTYMRGNFECRVRSDELLQMFGRAGRRGLDETGYVIVLPDRPRLFDSSEARLTRSNQLDWSSLIAVMNAAVERGEEPFAAARKLNESLFSRQQPALGVERSLNAPNMPCGLLVDAERAGFARPDKVQMRNFRMRWQNLTRAEKAPLGEAFVRSKGRWRPALCVASTLDERGQGNLCKISNGKKNGWIYGREIQLARRVEGSENEVQLSKWFFQNLRDLPALRGDKRLKAKKVHVGVLEHDLLPHLGQLIKCGTICNTEWRENQFFAQIDFSRELAPAHRDQYGNALIEPPQRKGLTAPCVKCAQLAICQKMGVHDSPAMAWRKLGLIDSTGNPTRRGVIFSYFNKGEGLAIAAALEDPQYPIDELIFDLANLRAGHRFAGDDSHYGGRLGMLCQELYDRATYAGYLELGVPVNYGDGAGEVVRDLMETGTQRPRSKMLTELLRPGDIERAFLEWLSLLRQIIHAPENDWERWQELKTAASQMLARADKREGRQKRLQFPALTPQQQKTGVNHRLYL